MEKLQLKILKLIILFAPIDKFYLSIGFRINYFEVLVLIFITLSLIEIISKPIKKKSLNAALLVYIKFQWGWLIIVTLSLFSFIYIYKTNNEILFFIKGFSQLFVYAIFFTFFILLLSKLDFKKRNELLNFYVFIILFSSLYGLFAIYLILYNGIDIDNILARLIPFVGSEISYADFAAGSFFRLTGLSRDPSVHASYCISAIVILLHQIFINKQLKKTFYLIVILLSFFFTMSGSGLTGLVVALMIILVFNLKNINLNSVLVFLTLTIPFVIFYIAYQETILHFIDNKFQDGGTTTNHWEIALESIRIGLKYPFFGVGYNNYAYMYKLYYNLDNFNSHNSFVSYFVETGFIGLFYKLFIFGFIAYRLFMMKDKFSHIMLAGFIGLSISALGYETYNIFLNQLIISLMFVISQIRNNKQEHITNKL